MKIQIELIKGDNETIHNGWLVTVGEKYADGLCYEEMLGLVSALTIPESKGMLAWLKTKEQHEAWKNQFVKKDNNLG